MKSNILYFIAFVLFVSGIVLIHFLDLEKAMYASSLLFIGAFFYEIASKSESKHIK